ncbi:MAG: hypothetical protein AAF597_02230, partial [Bacteroidota bacterium]
IEMDKLRQATVPAAEMDMVRAYLLGSIAMELDGHFGHGWRYRSALIKDYEPASFLRSLDETVRDISAEDIMGLAQRYLNVESWFEVVVGGGPRLECATQILRPEATLR